MSYVRVSILGNLVNEEVWSINPVFDPTLEFPGGVNQAALDSACLAIASLSPGAFMLSSLSLQGSINAARLEVRDDVTDGLIAISEQARSSPVTGSAAIRLGAQNAVVCSIRTDSPGASGRGRVYWPALGATVGTNGRLSAPAPGSLVADFKAYFLAMRSALATAFPTIGFDLAVRSKTTKTTPHAVRIQVGNVIDTQRRRRDSLPESYTSLTIP